MKKLFPNSLVLSISNLLILVSLSLPLVSHPPVVLALTFPQPTGLVNDFASVLNSQQKSDLENQLLSLKEATGIEFTIVTVRSLEETTIEDYATRLFENWKIGQKGQDNGLLFLVAPNERKVRFEVGYGLEATINDAKAGRILDDFVLPRFKEGQMAQGIIDGATAALQILQGQALPEPPTPKSSSGSVDWFYLLFLPFMLLQYLGAFLARSKSFWAGGVLGLIAGGLLGFLALHSVPFALGSSFLLGLIGLMLDFMLSRNYQALSRHGRDTSFWGSMGGFGRGGFGSGGFGGFSGGSSGGGGSSRSW